MATWTNDAKHATVFTRDAKNATTWANDTSNNSVIGEFDVSTFDHVKFDTVSGAPQTTWANDAKH